MPGFSTICEAGSHIFDNPHKVPTNERENNAVNGDDRYCPERRQEQGRRHASRAGAEDGHGGPSRHNRDAGSQELILMREGLHLPQPFLTKERQMRDDDMHVYRPLSPSAGAAVERRRHGGPRRGRDDAAGKAVEGTGIHDHRSGTGVTDAVGCSAVVITSNAASAAHYGLAPDIARWEVDGGASFPEFSLTPAFYA
jgi:hypothetical protein